MLHSGFKRTIVTTATVFTLFAQTAASTLLGCQCSHAVEWKQGSSCCSARATIQKPCAPRLSCCQTKSTERRQCQSLVDRKCCCDQHQDRHPVAISESPEKPTVALEIVVGDVSKGLAAIVASQRPSLASTAIRAGERASPSMQVLLCVWLA